MTARQDLGRVIAGGDARVSVCPMGPGHGNGGQPGQSLGEMPQVAALGAGIEGGREAPRGLRQVQVVECVDLTQGASVKIESAPTSRVAPAKSSSRHLREVPVGR